jgi:hypothetical protein
MVRRTWNYTFQQFVDRSDISTRLPQGSSYHGEERQRSQCHPG